MWGSYFASLPESDFVVVGLFVIVYALVMYAWLAKVQADERDREDAREQPSVASSRMAATWDRGDVRARFQARVSERRDTGKTA